MFFNPLIRRRMYILALDLQRQAALTLEYHDPQPIEMFRKETNPLIEQKT